MESTDPKPASEDADAALTPTTVSHCPTLNEAQMLVSLLASFGIQASIEGENYLRMLGSMVPGSDGIRVQVRQVDAEAALEILNQGPEPETIEE
jgi:hypothetical protein